MAHISKIKLANNTYDLKDTISPRVHYLEVEGTTYNGNFDDAGNGTWCAFDDTITEYYDGLMVLIYLPEFYQENGHSVGGATASGTDGATLNINDLGEIPVYYNSNIQANKKYFPAGSTHLLVYKDQAWIKDFQYQPTVINGLVSNYGQHQVDGDSAAIVDNSLCARTVQTSKFNILNIAYYDKNEESSVLEQFYFDPFSLMWYKGPSQTSWDAATPEGGKFYSSYITSHFATRLVCGAEDAPTVFSELPAQLFIKGTYSEETGTFLASEFVVVCGTDDIIEDILPSAGDYVHIGTQISQYDTYFKTPDAVYRYMQGYITKLYPSDDFGAPHYINNIGTSAGVWKGTDPRIGHYYTGLFVLFNTKSYAGNSSTTLNINNLGAKKVYYNTTTTMTSTYAPANTVQALVYDSTLNSNNGGWRSIYSYDSNSDTKVTQNWDITTDPTIWNRLLYTYNSSSSKTGSITSGTSEAVKYAQHIAVQPYTGTIAANLFDGGFGYLTSAPISANTTGGVKLVVLNSEPSTKYDGYLYN